MLKCKRCGMEFQNERRLEINSRTHDKKKQKNRKSSQRMPDFEKPDFSHVM